MRTTISKLTARISVSLVLLLITGAALIGYWFPTGSVSVRAAKRSPLQLVGETTPYIKLQESRELQANYAQSGNVSASSALQSGSTSPVAMTSADVDRDGFPDLLVGYAASRGGTITLHRGDKRAFAPEDPQVIQGIIHGDFPDPFVKEAKTYEVPVSPDFIGTGDFDRDSRIDLIATARGGTAMYLWEGDGQGGFSTPYTITLPGAVTAMVTGDINNHDGFNDVIIGIDTPGGHSLLVYDKKDSLLDNAPTQLTLPEQATSLALGKLDEDQLEDLAILAGGRVFILHGRNNSTDDLPAVKEAGRLEPVELQFRAKAIALGEFIWDRDGRVEIAALTEDGTVRIAARGDLDTRPMSPEEILAARQKMAREREQVDRARSRGERVTMIPAGVLAEPLRWQVVEDVAESTPEAMTTASAAVSDGGSSQPILLGARLSSLPTDDLLIMTPASSQIQIIYSEKQGKTDAKLEAQSVPKKETLRSLIALESGGELIDVLPMRLDVLAQPGLVVLKKGQSSPEIVPAAV